MRVTNTHCKAFSRHAASIRTVEVHAVLPIRRGIGPHEREHALMRVRVPFLAVAVIQAAAPQDVKPLLPFFGHEELRGQALQGQVEANEDFVQRPGWLAVGAGMHTQFAGKKLAFLAFPINIAVMRIDPPNNFAWSKGPPPPHKPATHVATAAALAQVRVKVRV